MNGRGPSDETLSELDFLASVEHALIVEYLTIYCALAEGVPPDGQAPGEVGAAAGVIHRLAEREMRHLHQVNALLVGAGRPPQVGRAHNIDLDGARIPLGAPSPADLERMVERQQSIATAVDRHYHRVSDAVAAVDPLFGLPDHVEPLEEFSAHLHGLQPQQFLRVTRREPAGEVERTLLHVSDLHYQLIVATVGASFAHEDELGELLGRAETTMDTLEQINHLLVAGGLLPAFALA